MGTESVLSATEIAQYQRDGHLCPSWQLSDHQLTPLRDAMARILAERDPDEATDFIPLPHAPSATASGASLEIARSFFGIVTDSALLDLVEPLIGPDIVMWASALFCKPAKVGLEVPWHQDGQYWPIRPRATVTVWIAIDPATVENGCMRVIPGSHLLGELNHTSSDSKELALNSVLDDPRVDLSNVHDVSLSPGQVSLHDANLVHGSRPNTSANSRAGFAIRYMPSSSLYDRSIDPGQASANVPLGFAERPIWLVRGVDRHGGNDFEMGHTHW